MKLSAFQATFVKLFVVVLLSVRTAEVHTGVVACRV